MFLYQVLVILVVGFHSGHLAVLAKEHRAQGRRLGAVVLVALNAHGRGTWGRQGRAGTGRVHVVVVLIRRRRKVVVFAWRRRTRQRVVSARGVESRVDGVRREADSGRGRLLVEAARVWAVHRAGLALLIADGAVIVRPHYLYVKMLVEMKSEDLSRQWRGARGLLGWLIQEGTKIVWWLSDEKE